MKGIKQWRYWFGLLSVGFCVTLGWSESVGSANQGLENRSQPRLQSDASRDRLPETTGFQSRSSGSPRSDDHPLQVASGNGRGKSMTLAQAADPTTGQVRPIDANALPTASAAQLPYPVGEFLTKAGIPLSSVGVYVQEISGEQRHLLSVNSTQPMNPASTMKLLTTYAALEIMGGDYQWITTLYRDGPVVDGVLRGNLIIKGTGDPKITAEDFKEILQKLQESGIQQIEGDVILDRTHFHLPPESQGSFDGNSTRSYNVSADPLMVSHKSIVVKLYGDPVTQQVMVSLWPHPKQVDLLANVGFDRAGCGDWQQKIRSSLVEKPEGGYRLTVSGRFSVDCGEKALRPIALSNLQQFFAGVFENEWAALGGTLTGHVREGVAPPNATPVVVRQSEALVNIVKQTNKQSNNLFAMQLFFSLGARKEDAVDSRERSTLAIREWLVAKRLYFPELVVENGSGLSRIERISAQSLAQLLEKAAYSPVFASCTQSLPVVGVDGTMGKRLRNKEVTGRAYIKTGTLKDVKAVAGYVQSQSGRDYVVVFLINHPNANSANAVAALDGLIEWVYLDGPITEPLLS